MEKSENGTQGVDHRREQWARAAVAFPVDAGAIEAQINDLQGKLNLNSLWSVRTATSTNSAANVSNDYWLHWISARSGWIP